MSQARDGDLRGLKALVGGLGIAVVLGTALVIGVIIKRLYASPAPPSNMSVLVSAPDAGGAQVPSTGPVLLPNGSKITGLAASGADIAVSVSGPAGDQLWIIDPQTGARSVAMSTEK